MFRATVKPQGNNMKAYRQSGFTLIEMVAVIIILAIMAATALPKFVNLSQEARLASINGLAGGLRSAAALAKSQWLAAQSGHVGWVSMAGTRVYVWSSEVLTNTNPEIRGYPKPQANGIVLALDNTTGYISAPIGTQWVFWPIGVTTSANCHAAYTQSGLVVVSANTLGCS
jgi:MSHA pilin protein MshA